MNKLKDTSQTPYCGWIYWVPETKTNIDAPNFSALIDEAMKNYEINNIQKDRETVSDEIQDYLCKKIPSGLCRGFVNHFVSNPRELINGTSALFRVSVGHGETYVSQEKAEERAEICSTCPGNANIKGGCKGNGIPEMISRLRRGRFTSLDDKLHVCVYCKCFLNLLVHISPKILEKTINSVRFKYYPDHCWKRKEIEHLRRK